MANRVKFSAAYLREVSNNNKKQAVNVRQAANLVDRAVNSRGWQCNEKYMIEQKLETVRSNLTRLASRMEHMAAISAQTAGMFEGVESKFNTAENSAVGIRNLIRNLIQRAVVFLSNTVKRLQEASAALWQQITNFILKPPTVLQNVFWGLTGLAGVAGLATAATHGVISGVQAVTDAAQQVAQPTYLPGGGAYYGWNYLKTSNFTEEQRSYACWFCSYSMILENMGIKKSPYEIYEVNGRADMIMNARPTMSDRLGVTITQHAVSGDAAAKEAQVRALLQDNPQGVAVYNSGHMSVAYLDEKGNILLNDPSNDKYQGVPIESSSYGAGGWGKITSCQTFTK